MPKQQSANTVTPRVPHTAMNMIVESNREAPPDEGAGVTVASAAVVEDTRTGGGAIVKVCCKVVGAADTAGVVMTPSVGRGVVRIGTADVAVDRGANICVVVVAPSTLVVEEVVASCRELPAILDVATVVHAEAMVVEATEEE